MFITDSVVFRIPWLDYQNVFLSPSKMTFFVNVRDRIFFFFMMPFYKKPFEVKLFK